MEAINENVTTKQGGLDMESIPALKENLESDVTIEPSESEKKESQTDVMITEEMVNDELEKIKSMNYIELNQFKNEAENQKKYLSDAKEAVNQLLKTKEQLETMGDDAENELGAKIAEADAEEKIDLPEDEIKSFLENYDLSIERIDQTIEAANARIEEFLDIKKTATFMNKNMLEITEKHLQEIDKIEASTGKVLKDRKRYFNEQKKIFSERDSVEFILSKIPEKKIFLKRWLASIKKEKLKNQKNSQIISSTQKNVTEAFCSVFSVQQMIAFEKYLKEILSEGNDNDTSVFLVQYMMYSIYTDEKVRMRGQGKWIETLIMNVLDILNDMYDLPNGIEYFNDQLKKVRDETLKDLPKIDF